MKLATATQFNNPQDIQSLVRYFQILSNVSTRIATSGKNIITIAHKGFIDTLEAKTTYSVSSTLIKNNCLSKQWEFSNTKLNNRGFYLKTTNKLRPQEIFYFRLDKIKNIISVVTNPRDFSSSVSYLNSLKSLIEPYEVKDLAVTRIDFTCDYQIDFNSFIRGLEVIGKQTRTDFRADSITGITFGKGNECIVAYDKSTQMKEETPRSRLEIKLKGKKLPIRSIADLYEPEHFLKSIEKKNPFESVNIFNLTVPDILKSRPSLQSFDTLLNAGGYQYAKQQSNKTGNFERDIGKFLLKEPYPNSAAQILLSGLKEYFNATKQGNYLR